MSDYLIWVGEMLIKDMNLEDYDSSLAWNFVMDYAQTHILAHTKYSIRNYLMEVK